MISQTRARDVPRHHVDDHGDRRRWLCSAIVEVSAHINALRREGRLMAAAAAAADLDTTVPTCPDWAVRDLLRHQGGVHRWATGIVAGPRTSPWRVDLDEVVGEWPADGQLVDWFRQGHAELITALSQADPGLDCWTFLAAPSPLAMWARRQAHETAVHRADAELAAGRAVSPFPAPFAADGIGELLACFITRPGGELRADPPVSLRVRCTDAPGDWRVRIGPDGAQTTPGAQTVARTQATPGTRAAPSAQAAPAMRGAPGADDADCTVSGRAAEVYLALWNRQPAGALTVDGDGQVLDLFRTAVQVRWS
jgi:uncharacterized protein (TIGR03083 family)